MLLKHLSLQNFRNYLKAAFEFSDTTTLLVGPNTAGKTNVLEAIALISTGKSFKAEKESEILRFGQDVARVKAVVGNSSDTDLEIVFTSGELSERSAPSKKYLVNGVPRRRVDFVSHLASVLFSPQDLDIIIDAPGLRRRFLNDVLEQTDRGYRLALATYEKALRQRNALLELVRDTGRRNEEQFRYWDDLLIANGTLITQKRAHFIEFLNKEKKDVFDCLVVYDKSIISKELLLQYQQAELGAGVTLVGPHRDDFSVQMVSKGTSHDVKLFGSRGQQRLAMLQLKLLQLTFMENALGYRPLLLLDDILSELDSEHIRLVLGLLGRQQTILATTHKEFIPKKMLSKMGVIELGKD